MTDLTAAQWHDIRDASIYLPQDSVGHLGRYIALDKLATVLRKSRRTNDQNALLWSLYEDALKIGGESLGGWTRDDVHEFLLGEFFGWNKLEAFGRTRLKPKKRSSRMTKTQFSEYLEFVVRKFAEYGIVLQLPGDTLGGSDG